MQLNGYTRNIIRNKRENVERRRKLVLQFPLAPLQILILIDTRLITIFKD